MEIDRDPHFGQFERECMGIDPRRLDRAGRRDLVEPIEHRSGGKGAPFGGLHPRDPPAFLVDQHRRRGIPNCVPKLADKGADLVRAFDIAREQDEAERIGVLEEPLFRVR